MTFTYTEESESKLSQLWTCDIIALVAIDAQYYVPSSLQSVYRHNSCLSYLYM
jgi:hypothetical protein